MAMTHSRHAWYVTARVLLLVVSTFGSVHLLGCAGSDESMPWGEAPYAQEHPVYLREVARYQRELEALRQALDALERNRALYMARGDENRWTLHLLRRLPGWDAALARRRDAAREAYEAAWARWATQRMVTLPLDLSRPAPTPRAARRHLWHYNLERLRRWAAYLRAELLYRDMELAVIRADYGRYDPIGQRR